MPFRLWFYLVKIVAPLLFGVLFLTWALPRNPLGEVFYRVALYSLIALGVTGALMGLLLVLGWLRMRCPFCGRYGPVGGSKEDGLWLDCTRCGLVHGAGLFRLRLVREKITETNA
jgi:hypothetical protein